MSGEPERITVDEGKYTLVMDPTNMRALRYGEAWRDLVGDGFVMALGQEISRLRAVLRALAGGSEVTEGDGWSMTIEGETGNFIVNTQTWDIQS